ncbi:MAG TPA: LacI family DNA-binding transcriptional regulator [Clostridia bacterium]|nr:LacI family DNA-binding transcriptional regulator [Clostridia bacterium]
MDIRDIAKRAKVSTATVSRTINRVPTVDPQLAKRVWKIIDELGYYPNKQARALVSGRSRLFGLIVSEITNPFFPEIIQVFEDIAVQHNYEILTTSTVHDPKRMELSVRRMIERRVDGVAVMTFGMEESLLLDDPKLQKVPLVFVDVGPRAPHISNIRIDYQHGIRQAVQHIAALRHERIAFISGPPDLKSAIARQSAFEASMHEIRQQIDPDLIIAGDHTIEGGMQAMGKLLRLPKRPTAVLCSNDMTALGVMHECYKEGIHIPTELSVVGYDDIRLARFVLPPLTTVQMSQAELARLAFHALLADVERETPAEQGTEYVLQTNLVLRDSTALAPSHSR